MSNVASTPDRNKAIDEAPSTTNGGITSDQAQALAHWSLYGRAGNPSPTRTTASQWESQPFTKPHSTNWSIPVSDHNLVKLLNGFCPEEMEDKWFIYADGPDADGNVKLHMHRSWTGYKVVELDIKVSGDDGDDANSQKAEITGITWETDVKRVNDMNEEMAKGEALEVCNWVLGTTLVG